MSKENSYTITEVYSDSAEFIEAAMNFAEDIPKGQKREFTCPLCGGTAVIGKAAYNGHVYAHCDCGSTIMQ